MPGMDKYRTRRSFLKSIPLWVAVTLLLGTGLNGASTDAADQTPLKALGADVYTNEAGEVVEVLFISIESLTNEDLAILPRYSTIESLSIIDCEGIGGAGIAHLPDLPMLTELDLSGCMGVDAHALVHVSDCNTSKS